MNPITNEEYAFIGEVLGNEPNTDVIQHTLVLGSFGKGKSIFQESIPDIELSEEDKQIIKMNMEAERNRKEVRNHRMKMLKLTYINESTDEMLSSELHTIYEALHEIGLSSMANREGVTRVFLNLPDEIFGSGMSWGFDDTEVRDNIYEYITTTSYDVLLKE